MIVSRKNRKSLLFMGRAGSLQRQLPSRTLSLPFKRSGSKLCLRFARQSLRTGVLKARAGQMPHGCPVNSYVSEWFCSGG